MNFFKLFLANPFTYFVLSLISIVCLYRRVFPVKRFQWTSLDINMLITALGAAVFIACALQCRPLAAYWDHSIEGKCLDGKTLFIVNHGLQRSWQDKLALNGVFALGCFVRFGSIYCIVVLFWINTADTTYTVYQATLWNHIKPSVGIIYSYLPTISGLFLGLNISGHCKRTLLYYIKNGTHFSLSSSKYPDSGFYRLDDNPISCSTSGTNAGPANVSHLGATDIQIQTDIAILEDFVSIR